MEVVIYTNRDINVEAPCERIAQCVCSGDTYMGMYGKHDVRRIPADACKVQNDACEVVIPVKGNASCELCQLRLK